jgi:hypothetical protein
MALLTFAVRVLVTFTALPGAIYLLFWVHEYQCATAIICALIHGWLWKR